MTGTPDNGTERVRTSVVVPVYNDPDGLRTTVESLLDQDATDYEVIVADNGSTDGTAAVASEYARADRVRHVVEDARQSSYAARNAGIEAARGEVIGFLDADMWVESDYVEAITERILADERSYVGCRVELVAGEGRVERYRRATGFDVAAYIRENHFAPTCCLVTHRDLFERVGRFDGRLRSNGDLEFGRRVHDAGIDLAYAPDITVYHPARASARDVVGQSGRIGHGQAQLRAHHGDRFEVRPALDPRRYLPVNPFAFRRSIGEAARSRTEMGLWYALACAQKWAIAGGYLRGLAAGRADRPDPR